MTRSKFLLMLWLIACACTHDKPVDPMFRWPKSGCARADSLLLEYEKSRNRYPYDPTQPGALHATKFCEIADTSSDPILKFRAAYIRVCHSFDACEYDEAIATIRDAELMIDSARHPYDWHMMQTFVAEFERNPAKKYFMLKDNLAYFQSHEAYSEIPRILNCLGHVMEELNDSVNAAKYYNQSKQLCLRLGFRRHIPVAAMNEANVSPPRKRKAIYRSLIGDDDVRNNPQLMSLVYTNYFIETDSVRYIDVAMKLTDSLGINIGITPLIYASKGDWLSRHGQKLGGIRLLEKAKQLIVDGEIQASLLPQIYDKIALAYMRLGMEDSAAVNWRMCAELLDRQLYHSGRTQLQNTLIKERVGLVERNTRLQIEKQWIVMLLILLCTAGIAYVVVRRVRRWREDLVSKLSHNRQIMLAQATVLEEQDNFIASVSDEIDRKNVGNEVARLMQLHRSGETKRHELLKMRQSVTSNFFIRLKKDFPSLTEKQLRMAAYIISGADSHMIAKLMNITIQSVHTGRYRLRTRLGLSTDDSLENFLHRYNNP